MYPLCGFSGVRHAGGVHSTGTLDALGGRLGRVSSAASRFCEPDGWLFLEYGQYGRHVWGGWLLGT